MSEQVEDFRQQALHKEWSRQKEFSFVKNSQDPRFGEVAIHKSSATKEVVFIKTNVYSQAKDALNEIDNLTVRKSLNHVSILRFLDYSSSIQKNLCSTSYLVNSIFSYPRTDTFKESQGLKQKHQSYSGDQLEQIAVQSLQGIAHLHNRSLSHGDLRPQMIGFDNASNRYVILDRLKDFKPLEKIQVENIAQEVPLYMSPELYRRIDGKDKEQDFDSKKNDTFALGLCLLELGNLEEVQDIYEKKGQVNRDVLFNHVAKFDKKYKGKNPNLSRIVNNLVEIDPEHRKDSLELLRSVDQKLGNSQQINFSNQFSQQPKIVQSQFNNTHTTYVVNSQPQYQVQSQYRAMSFVNNNFQKSPQQNAQVVRKIVHTQKQEVKQPEKIKEESEKKIASEKESIKKEENKPESEKEEENEDVNQTNDTKEEEEKAQPVEPKKKKSKTKAKQFPFKINH